MLESKGSNVSKSHTKLLGEVASTLTSWSDWLVVCRVSGASGGDGGCGQRYPGWYDQTIQEPQSHIQHCQQTAGQEPQTVCHHEGGEECWNLIGLTTLSPVMQIKLMFLQVRDKMERQGAQVKKLEANHAHLISRNSFKVLIFQVSEKG